MLPAIKVAPNVVGKKRLRAAAAAPAAASDASDDDALAARPPTGPAAAAALAALPEAPAAAAMRRALDSLTAAAGGGGDGSAELPWLERLEVVSAEASTVRARRLRGACRADPRRRLAPAFHPRPPVLASPRPARPQRAAHGRRRPAAGARLLRAGAGGRVGGARRAGAAGRAAPAARRLLCRDAEERRASASRVVGARVRACARHQLPSPARPCAALQSHMAKVKDRLLLESRKLTAVSERRAQRDGARHAKAVQVERLKAKALERRGADNALKQWKKHRGDAEAAGANRDRALEGALAAGGGAKAAGKVAVGAHSFKRKGKEAKYGHGGQKRYLKDNDARSSRDMTGFNPARNKALPPGLAHKAAGKRVRDGAAPRRAPRAAPRRAPPPPPLTAVAPLASPSPRVPRPQPSKSGAARPGKRARHAKNSKRG
jgi:hypothetical protein